MTHHQMATRLLAYVWYISLWLHHFLFVRGPSLSQSVKQYHCTTSIQTACIQIQILLENSIRYRIGNTKNTPTVNRAVGRNWYPRLRKVGNVTSLRVHALGKWGISCRLYSDQQQCFSLLSLLYPSWKLLLVYFTFSWKLFLVLISLFKTPASSPTQIEYFL